MARGVRCESHLLLMNGPTEGSMPEPVRAIAGTLTTIQQEAVAILPVE